MSTGRMGRLFHFKREYRRGGTCYTTSEKNIEIHETWFNAIGEAIDSEDWVTVSVLEGEIRSHKVTSSPDIRVTAKFKESKNDFQVTCSSFLSCKSIGVLLKDILGSRTKPVVAALCNVGGADMSDSLRKAGCTVSSQDYPDKEECEERSPMKTLRSGPGCTVS